MESENLSTLKNVDRRAWKNQAFSAEAVPVSVLPFYSARDSRTAEQQSCTCGICRQLSLSTAASLSAMNLSAAEFDSSEFVGDEFVVS